MKLFPLQNYRPVRFTMVASFGLLCGLLTIPCWAQQNIAQLPAAKTPAAKLPFDVFNEPIDGIQIYMHLENNANAQKQVQATDAVDILRQQLLAAKTSSDVSLDALTSHPLVNSDDLYPHMVKSCLYLGRFYNCGKCDRTHVAMACGVVIDESGLALTIFLSLRMVVDLARLSGLMREAIPTTSPVELKTPQPLEPAPKSAVISNQVTGFDFALVRE